LSSAEDLFDAGQDASLFCLNAQGATLMSLAEYSKAASIYRRAVAAALSANGDDDDSTLTFKGNLAVALLKLDALDESFALLTDVLAHREKYLHTAHARSSRSR
jgi:Tetratricopeptide repeat